jgi:hypothetical protein
MIVTPIAGPGIGCRQMTRRALASEGVGPYGSCLRARGFGNHERSRITWHSGLALGSGKSFPEVQLAGGATNAPIFNFRAIPICGIMVKQMECWRDPTKRSNSSDERSKGSS